MKAVNYYIYLYYSCEIGRDEQASDIKILIDLCNFSLVFLYTHNINLFMLPNVVDIRGCVSVCLVIR